MSTSINTPVYLDYAATTPIDPHVIDVMTRYLGTEGTYANPASRSHMLGWLAEQAVEGARRQVADLIHADPREIVWTSGATEADNLALTGLMRAQRKNGLHSSKRHLITSTIEHKAIIDTALSLEREGFEVTWLTPDNEGRITPESLAAAMRPETALVSLMAVNNEVGSVNDLDALGRIAHDGGALFHVDAAQAAGKIPLNVEEMPIDLMSLSAHKLYGPKGIGALYVRQGVTIEAIIHGGGHERGMRSGTLATHQIAGMGKAYELAAQQMHEDRRHLQQLHDRVVQWAGTMKGAYLSIPPEDQVPNIVSIGFDDLEGQTLLMNLREVAVSNGSACNSATVAPSYVLVGVGVPEKRALATLRISMGRFTTEEEVEFALRSIEGVVTRLRPEELAANSSSK
ncbi:Cysteine desulfurase IscS [Halomonadaceae bacterium LMG 33818]|uniref:cysteine desulfurase family protein n=1 Tax=Cernens ardua TaxID=3402176 RepID=UPI003EDC060E